MKSERRQIVEGSNTSLLIYKRKEEMIHLSLGSDSNTLRR